MDNTICERINIETEETMFLNRLESSFNLSPITCEAILSLVKSVFIKDEMDNNLHRAGRMKVYTVSEKEPPGKPTKKCELTPVIITADTREDMDVYREHGLAAYRQQVICRVTEEAFEQGGLLTIEDLVRILKSSVRTIKRDIATLRERDIIVRTRGYIKDIGRGTSHKAKIVELWLKRYTYTEIKWHTRHSLESIKRYLINFGRVILLMEKNYSPTDTRFIVGISETLYNEYIELYHKHNTSEYRDRIEELTSEVKVSELKKEGCQSDKERSAEKHLWINTV